MLLKPVRQTHLNRLLVDLLKAPLAPLSAPQGTPEALGQAGPGGAQEGGAGGASRVRTGGVAVPGMVPGETHAKLAASHPLSILLV